MAEVKANWRCNVVHDWVEQVPQEAAGALYDRLGYSQDLIRQLGCSPPLGAPRPRFWGGRTPRSAHRTRAPGGTRPSPRPRSRRSWAGSTSTSTSSRRRSTCFGPPWSAAWSCPASAPGKWWARRSSRPPGATCAGFARASGGRAAGGPGCSRSRGGTKTRPHACSWMDEPPEQLYNQWIRDRMEFYKRVEPTEPPTNERLVLGDASTPRMRFSSSRMSPLPCGRSF